MESLAHEGKEHEHRIDAIEHRCPMNLLVASSSLPYIEGVVTTTKWKVCIDCTTAGVNYM